MIKLIIGLFLCCFFYSVYFFEANASVIKAKSCSQSDVQKAINKARNGDTVVVPAGECTWLSAVTIPNRKGVTLKGAGIDETAITDATSARAIKISGADGKPFRITDFTFTGGSGSDAVIQVTGTCKNFRLDHLKFNALRTRAFTINGYTYGVIDHCQFVGPSPFGMEVLGGTQDGGTTAWGKPLALGTAAAVYIEDCTFDFANYAAGVSVCDSFAGGRYVFRHNRVKNIDFGNHDACVNQQRGTFSWEIYNNEFNYTGDEKWYVAKHRGGTGVLFNNKFRSEGGWEVANPVGITNYRSRNPVTCQTLWATPCNGGTREKMCSDASRQCTKNSDCPVGTTCIQIDGNQDGTGYPCRDQIGVTGATIQVSAPAYEWNNYQCKGSLSCDPVLNVDFEVYGIFYGNPLQAGRDYHNDAQMPEYIPYTYPHPLVTDIPAPTP